MAIDDLATWKDEGDPAEKDEFNNPRTHGPNALVPTEAAASGAEKMADWIASAVDNKLAFASPVVCDATYTFGKAAFIAIMSTAAPTPSPAVGASVIADAWEAGVNAATMVPNEAGYIGSPALPSSWSAPPSVVLQPASVSGAKAGIVATLSAMPNVNKFPDSALSGALRDAFLGLQYLLSGVNQQPPPTGPLPLSTIASVE